MDRGSFLGDSALLACGAAVACIPVRAALRLPGADVPMVAGDCGNQTHSKLARSTRENARRRRMTHPLARGRRRVMRLVLIALAWAPAARVPTADAQVTADIDSVRISLSGQLDVDTRIVRGPLPGRSGMLLRRAEITLDATAPGGWTLRLHPDFSQGRAQLLDAYVTWGRDAWSVRVGRQKVAYGVEYPLAPATLLFPEYGVVNSLVIGRQFGVQVSAATPRGSLTIGGYEPAALREALIDVEHDPEGPPQLGPHGVARATWRPLPVPTDGAAPPLELQVAGAYGRYRTTDPSLPGLPRYLTPAQRPALAFRVGAADDPASTALSDGARFGGSVGAQLVAGGLHLIVEGAEMTQHVRLGSAVALDRERLSHAAWQARAGWLVGGRRTAAFEVLPRGRGGAWEFGARVGGVRFDRDAARFASPSAAARAMTSGGVALAWVPRRQTRLSTSMDVTRLTGPTEGTERAMIIRVMQAF